MTIYCMKKPFKATKVLSPERKVMAVITDTPDAYRFLENVKLFMYNPYYEKAVAYPSGTDMTGDKIEVLFFDSFDKLDTPEKLGFFNYVYIGHNQSINISEEVEKNLNSWISKGNAMVLETGADFKKTNSILPESLNPVKISEAEAVQMKNLWFNMGLNNTVQLAKAKDTNGGDVIVTENHQVGVVNKIGKGSILTLLVNMAQEPIASWNSKTPFIESLLATYANNTEYTDPYYSSQFQYLAQQVQTDKEPPYLFMTIALGLYVLLAAPILYIILKRMDKRDYAWISIPALALVCIFALYLFGSGTRYTKGILSSISVLTADMDSGDMEVVSDIYVFNNKKGSLQIEWNADENIKIMNDRRDPYFSYTYDPNMDNQVKSLNGKMTLGHPRLFEKYNTSLWSSVYITADKTVPFKVDKMITMELKGKEISVHVKNTTPYTLKNSFIQWGQGYLFIGDLEPGQEKSVTEQIDKGMYSNFETFIDKKMGLKYFDYSKRPTAEDQRNMRTMELLLQRYVYSAYQYAPTVNTQKFDIETIKLCALNDQDIGYDIKVNKEETESYATNIIEISSKVEFEKGTVVTFPPNIIMPTVNYYLDDSKQAIGGFDYQAYDQYYRFYEQGIVTMDYHVPESIKMTSAKLQLGEVYNEQDYYNKSNGQPATSKNVQYMIYNSKTGAWEETDKVIEISGDEYVNSDGNITIKVDLRDGQTSANYSYAQMMKAPSITIEGSVK